MARRLAPLLLAAALLGPLPTQAAEALAQVFGGTVTTRYPTVGAVLRLYDGHNLCTGTLIGCRTVMTAAHCIRPFESSLPLSVLLSPDQYKVYLQHAGLFEVESVTVHEDWSRDTDDGWRNDIALIRLREPVAGVKPDAPLSHTALARLAPANDTEAIGQLPRQSSGIIAGFGYSAPSDPARGIKRAGCIVTDACTMPSMAPSHICWRAQSVCGRPLAGAATRVANTCGGDSGGPLFIDIDGDRFVAGVTSGGVRKNCDDPRDIPTDVNVARFEDWLRAKLGREITAPRCGSIDAVGEPTVFVDGKETALDRRQGEAVAGTYTVWESAKLLRIGINGSDDGTFDFTYAIVPPPGAPAPLCDVTRPGRDRHRQFAFCEIESPAPGEWSVRVRQLAGERDGLVQVTFTAFR